MNDIDSMRDRRDRRGRRARAAHPTPPRTVGLRLEGGGLWLLLVLFLFALLCALHWRLWVVPLDMTGNKASERVGGGASQEKGRPSPVSAYRVVLRQLAPVDAKAAPAAEKGETRAVAWLSCTCCTRGCAPGPAPTAPSYPPARPAPMQSAEVHVKTKRLRW